MKISTLSTLNRIELIELESSYRFALKICYALEEESEKRPNDRPLKKKKDRACSIMKQLEKQLCDKDPERCLKD